MQNDAAFTMYTKRWQLLPAAFFGGIFLAISIVVMLGGTVRGIPQVIGMMVLCICSAFISLFGFYWALTPVPLLLVNDGGIAFQEFPLVLRRVCWEDVNKVRAIKGRVFSHGKYRRDPDLTIHIALDSQAAARYGGHQRFAWTLRSADLALLPEEIVANLRRFHDVEYQDIYDRLR